MDKQCIPDEIEGVVNTSSASGKRLMGPAMFSVKQTSVSGRLICARFCLLTLSSRPFSMTGRDISGPMIQLELFIV